MTNLTVGRFTPAHVARTWLMLPITVALIAGCDTDQATAPSDFKPAFDIIPDTTCPAYWRADYPSCRRLNPAEKEAIQRVFFDPEYVNMFRRTHENCDIIRQTITRMMTNDEFYVAEDSETDGHSYHHSRWGILLSSVNFLNINTNGTDVTQPQRLYTVSHEVGHRAFDEDEARLDQIANFCTYQQSVDPWGLDNASGGGGGPGLTCVPLYIDHYYYYPDNGETEYLYTVTTTLCYSGNMQ